MTSVLHVSTFFKCRFQSDHISFRFIYTDIVIRKEVESKVYEKLDE